jgi:hypothetical protein
MADGLSALVDQALRSALAPANGGDRPRVTVTMSLRDLKAALDKARPGWDAGLVPPHPPGATTLAGDWPNRWRIELDAKGIPVTIPPVRDDPARTPMYHPRHPPAPRGTNPPPTPTTRPPPEPPTDTTAPPDSDTRT